MANDATLALEAYLHDQALMLVRLENARRSRCPDHDRMRTELKRAFDLHHEAKSHVATIERAMKLAADAQQQLRTSLYRLSPLLDPEAPIPPTEGRTQ